jgi:hypothetical protein
MLTDYVDPCLLTAPSSPPLTTVQQAEARAAAMRASWTGTTVLAPKGTAVAALYRFLRAARALDSAARADVTRLLAEELAALAGLTIETDTSDELLVVLDPRCGAVSVALGSDDCPTCRPPATP